MCGQRRGALGARRQARQECLGAGRGAQGAQVAWALGGTGAGAVGAGARGRAAAGGASVRGREDGRAVGRAGGRHAGRAQQGRGRRAA